MIMSNKWSYHSLEPHLFNLRFGGYFQIDPNSPTRRKYLHSIYSRVILFLVILYTMQQIIKVYQVHNELGTVMETLFLLLTHIVSIYKQMVMYLKADEVQEILDMMKGPVFNQTKEEHEKLLKKTSHEAKIVLRISNISALITCFLWVVYPLVLFLQGKHVTFSIWLPYDVQISSQFILTLLYIWVQTSWLAVNNTTIDILISFLLEQCSAQIKILRYNLENMVQSCNNKFIDESVEEPFDLQFRKVLSHHREIIRFFKQIEDIFGGAVMCQFLFSAWILCATGYRLVEIDTHSIQFLLMILYLLCMLQQLFVYCFHGSELVYASENMMESSYFMNWLDLPVKNRKHLIFFMEKIKEPIAPKAGIIVPLSNTTFVTIVRSSYTFYAFLKNSE